MRGFPLKEEAWADLDLETRVGLASATLLILLESTDADRNSAIRQVCDNALNNKAWYLNSCGDAGDFHSALAVLQGAIQSGSLRSKLDTDADASWAAALQLVRSGSPILAIWERCDWSMFKVFIVNGCSNPDPKPILLEVASRGIQKARYPIGLPNCQLTWTEGV